MLIPEYIDEEAWFALLETRRAKKVPNTDYAQKLLLYELLRIKQAGHDPNAAMKQSIIKGYTDVYPPKDKEIAVNRASEAEKTATYLDEQAKHRASIRRVS